MESATLLALIAVIVIIALLFLGPIVSSMFQNSRANLNGSTS